MTDFIEIVIKPSSTSILVRKSSLVMVQRVRNVVSLTFNGNNRINLELGEEAAAVSLYGQIKREIMPA